MSTERDLNGLTQTKPTASVVESKGQGLDDVRGHALKVARAFYFESAHRLPWYDGACAQLHGHSYTMTVELHGRADERGMLVDFRLLKELVQPLVDQWDHATLVAESDTELLEVVRSHRWRHFVLPFDSTAENLCLFAARYLSNACKERFPMNRIQSAQIEVRETRNSTAGLFVRL